MMDVLTITGFMFGYFPRAKIRQIQWGGTSFDRTGINMIYEGHRHFCAVLRERNFLKEYLGRKLDFWDQEILTVSRICTVPVSVSL